MTSKQDIGLDYRRWDIFIQTVNFHLDRSARYIATSYLDPTREIWTVVAEFSSFLALIGPYVRETDAEIKKMREDLKQRTKEQKNRRVNLYDDYDLIPIHDRIAKVKDVVYNTDFIADMHSAQPKKKSTVWSIMRILEFTLFEISSRMSINEFIPKPKNKEKDPGKALRGGEF